MAAVPSLLSATVRQLSRSAYGVVMSPVRGFQVFRIDGYSWTTALAAGEGITSGYFAVGGRNWCIDYYPNGTNTAATAAAGEDSNNAISVYLRLASAGAYGEKQRVRAEYKFSLLDAAGNAAYELPAVTNIFTSSAGGYGLPGFVTKEELERRRETLLGDDCLAIRCDVGVTEVGVVAIAPKEIVHNSKQQDDGDDSDWEGGGESSRRRRQPLDDREYIRRSLAKNRRA
ncbi:unnamed protein product [Urochloa humidicola]